MEASQQQTGGSATFNKEIAQRRFLRTALAYLFYYTGLAERYRRQAVEAGAPPWRILSYPHIVDPEQYPIPLPFESYVRPRTFEKNMRFLSKRFPIVSLPDLLKAINQGSSIEPNTICITFDLCWKDHYLYAYPLLRDLHIPATMFIAAGYPDTDYMLWRDTMRIALFVLQGFDHPLPRFEELDQGFYEAIEEVSADCSLTDHVIGFTLDYLEALDAEIRAIVSYKIIKQVELYGRMPVFSMFAGWDAIKEMAASKVITFGTHGHGYKLLPTLGREELAEDMRSAMQAMRDNGIEPIEAVSFPYAAYDSSLLVSFGNMGLRFALGNEVSEEIDPTKRGTLVLERVTVNQAAASCNEILVSRMLAIPLITQLYKRKSSNDR